MTAAHFVAVFDGCAGAELACGHLGASAPLAAGQDVVIRVGTNPSVADNFGLSVGPPLEYPVPPNDTHLGAIAVGVPSTTTGTTRGATQDSMSWGPVCAPLVNDAIWYSFTAPDDDVYVFDTNGSEMTDMALAVFEACDSNGPTVPALLVCDDNFGAGEQARLDGFLEAGTSLCIAVAGRYLSEEGDTVLNVTRLGDPPENDSCDLAREISVGETAVQDNYTAAPANVVGACPVGNFPLWFSFTAPVSGLYKLDTKASIETSPDIAVYDSCSAATPIACSIDPKPAVFASLEAGQSVRIRASTDVFWRSEMAVRVGPMREDEGGSGGAGGSGSIGGAAGAGGEVSAGGESSAGGVGPGGGGAGPREKPEPGCDCHTPAGAHSPHGGWLLMLACALVSARRRGARSPSH